MSVSFRHIDTGESRLYWFKTENVHGSSHGGYCKSRRVTSAPKRWSGVEGRGAGTERRAGVIEIGWSVERAVALRKNALNRGTPTPTR